MLQEFSEELEVGKEKGALKEVDIFKNFEAMHRKKIDGRGRYPHRNVAAGRETTREKKSWLESGGATPWGC